MTDTMKYRLQVDVTDGDLEHLEGRVDGRHFRVMFEGTLHVVPDALLDDLDQLDDDSQLSLQADMPIFSIGWIAVNTGDTLADTFADLVYTLDRESYTLNGAPATDSPTIEGFLAMMDGDKIDWRAIVRAQLPRVVPG